MSTSKKDGSKKDKKLLEEVRDLMKRLHCVFQTKVATHSISKLLTIPVKVAPNLGIKGVM